MPPFDWTIRTAAWAPRGRPAPPFGPTALEVIRSCPLRVCFEHSRGYEPRLSFAARIGNAFHKTFEDLNGASAAPLTGAALAQWVGDRFAEALQAEETEADSRPRERGLPRSPERQAAALEALLEAAYRLAGTVAGGAQEPAATHPPEGIALEVEVQVSSRNGLFRGRVDRAEHTPLGTHLVDFKSALRDDLPPRYERQLQLYAFMWRDTRGDWPVTAEVVYPLAGTSHPVSIEPEACAAVAAESVALIAELDSTTHPAQLGRPGEVCQVCSYRPWCDPFWKSQAGDRSPLAAMERARLGVEGVLESLQRTDSMVKAVIRWSRARVEFVVPANRFPHLLEASPGTRVRLLDCELRGMHHQPRARVTDRTELFLVDPPSTGR